MQCVYKTDNFLMRPQNIPCVDGHDAQTFKLLITTFPPTLHKDRASIKLHKMIKIKKQKKNINNQY